MPRLAFLVCLVPLALVGCIPLKLFTCNRLAFDTPVNGKVSVETDSPPPTRTGVRVVPMPLEGCPGKCPGSKIALIDVDGLLMNQNMAGFSSVGDNPVALFKEKLDAAAAEPGTCAVILRINTPGGSVNACDVMFQELRLFRARTRLPVIACVLDVAAGGGYFLASGCDLIIAAPTSVVGGIGVIWNGYNLRDAMQAQSIYRQTVKSGPNIDMGSSVDKYPDGVMASMKAMAADYHEHFKTQIRKVRPRIPDQCRVQGEENADVFDGRVLTAGQAAGCGLVDSLGYLDDAIAAGRELAQQPSASVVMFHRANDPAFSAYTITPNTPIQNTVIPYSIPGADRSKLPGFLFMWQPEPTVERLTGR